MTQPVVVASQNPDKIAEIESVLADLGVQISRGHTWPEVEETEDTLVGNALLKARAVVAHTGLPAIADDTGLEVDALDGAPGVHTARYAGPDARYEDNVAKLLNELGAETNRTARFRTAVAMVTPDGDELTVEGSLEGTIAFERRGNRGFGYDPVFEVGGSTLAEIDIAAKHEISHRARALRALQEALSR
ncbi:MAG: RdgB/HAM1 family non-canonical purine NTP pyrophosphatase [Acidimicrobiia bacterium]|nr:RdgB/HAM1 family non-canonical purine NTP pyrophosphatase [Acidimicrobiia bacterium]